MGLTQVCPHLSPRKWELLGLPFLGPSYGTDLLWEGREAIKAGRKGMTEKWSIRAWNSYRWVSWMDWPKPLWTIRCSLGFTKESSWSGIFVNKLWCVLKVNFCEFLLKTESLWGLCLHRLAQISVLPTFFLPHRASQHVDSQFPSQG